MKLVILGASGATGQELTRQALARGHEVVAVVRQPDRFALAAHPGLVIARADAHDPESIARALGDGAIVLSGLGVKGREAGVLSAGARAVIAARPRRIVWLGAYGTGGSARAAGWATRSLLSLMGPRLADKVSADASILAAGGSVLHAGPLSNGSMSLDRRTVSLAAVPRRFFPARVSRATVAASMLDEAESPRFAGAIGVPLER